MARPIEQRLDRVEGARMAATARSVEETDRHLAVARAKVAIGAVARHALLRAGIDPASVPCLGQADEAAALLAASGKTPSEPDETASALPFDPTRPPTAFEAKILALAECFTDGSQPDFAKASFAQLFAWSLVRLSPEPENGSAPMGSDRIRCSDLHSGPDKTVAPEAASGQSCMSQRQFRETA